MPYNFAVDSFHTKKLCSRLSSSEVRFFTEIGRLAFLRPPLGDVWATYDDHLRLIGRRVVDFLLVLIEFFGRCYGWGAIRANIYFAPTGASWPKISGEKVAPTNHSFSEKTRLNDLSYGVKIWTYLSSVLLQFTRLTDGQTERRTDEQLSHRNTASAFHRAR